MATFSNCLIKLCAVFQSLQGLQGNFIAVWDTHFTDICLMDILLRYLKKACNWSKALLSFVGVTQVSYKQVKWNMNVFQHTKVIQEKQPIAHSARAGQTETRVTLCRQETEMSGLSAGPLYTLLKISSNRHAGHFSWIHQSQRQGQNLFPHASAIGLKWYHLRPRKLFAPDWSAVRNVTLSRGSRQATRFE